MEAVAQKQAEAIESGVGGFAQHSDAEGKSGGAEDSVANVLAALTGVSPEECSQAPNLILNPSKGTSGQNPDLGTAFTMNTDAGGEVSARVASGAAEFVPTGSSTAVPISSNQGFSSSTGQVATLGSGDSFVGTGASVAADARSGEGKAVAASSMAPSDGAAAPADVATAAGAESTAAGTDTAAGGAGNAGTPPSNPTPGPVTSPPVTGPATPV